MIGKLYKKEQIIFTTLSEDEVFDKLEKYTFQFKHNNKESKTFFKGKIDRNHHTFLIIPKLDDEPKNQIFPKITGEIKEHTNGVIIKLKIELPKEIEFIFDFALILNALFLIILPFVPIIEDDQKYFFIFGIPVVFFVSFLISKFFFNSKISDAITLIKRMLNA